MYFQNYLSNKIDVSSSSTLYYVILPGFKNEFFCCFFFPLNYFLTVFIHFFSFEFLQICLYMFSEL